MNNEQYCGTIPILESEPINIPNVNYGLVTAIPREDMTFDVFKRSKFLLDKRTEYKDDKVLSRFLTSDKSDEYKYSIIKLLETDYSRFTYGEPKINKALAMKLNEINFEKFKKPELVELGKNLGLKFNVGIWKQELIEQIELVKKQFQKVNKNL